MQNVMNRYFGKPKSLKQIWLLIANLLASTGYAMIWPVTTLYMTGKLNQTYTMAGVVLMITSIMSIIGAYIGGRLFDKCNPFKVTFVISILLFINVFLLQIWNLWPVFAVMIWLFSFGNGLLSTMFNSYAATMPGDKTRIIFNNMYIVLNVGVVLGTLSVGYLYDYGFARLMTLSTIIYGVLIVIIAIHFREPVKDVSEKEEEENEETADKFKKTPLILGIGLLLFITYMAYILWETVMAPYMRNMGLPTSNYADLWVLNGLTIILFQKLVSAWANKYDYRVSILLGTVIFASSFIVLIFAKDFIGIVIAFEILTFGEMLQSPQVPAWIAQMVPKELTGRAQGYVSMMISAGRMAGPIFSGVLMDAGYMREMFISVFIIMILTAVLLASLSKKASLNANESVNN